MHPGQRRTMIALPNEYDEDGNRIWTMRQASNETGYGISTIEAMVARGWIKKCAPGRLTQATVNWLIERRKLDLQNKGRPKGYVVKKRHSRLRMVHVTEIVGRRIDKLRIKHKFKSDADLMDAIFLHLETCDGADLDGNNKMYSEDGAVVDIDMNGI